MIKRLAPAILTVLVASLAAAGLEWEEIGYTATVVSDYKTGLPAIIFNTGLAYNETPETMRLRITWEVFSLDGGTETMLYEYTKTTTLRQGVGRIFSASQSVRIDARARYGARVWIDDIENDLSYQRSYSYLVPQSLPVGLRLVGWDGTEEADLASMPDAELEELVMMRRAIASYEVLAENVSIASLFSLYAASEEDYPVAVILLPETGVDNNWGSETQPITVTFGLAVLVFTVPSSDANAGFQQQLSQYDQTFTGTVYAGVAGNALGQGAVIFVHDAMNVILDAAVEEQAARSQ